MVTKSSFQLEVHPGKILFCLVLYTEPLRLRHLRAYKLETLTGIDDVFLNRPRLIAGVMAPLK